MFGKKKNDLRSTRLGIVESLEKRDLFAVDFGFAAAAPVGETVDVAPAMTSISEINLDYTRCSWVDDNGMLDWPI